MQNNMMLEALNRQRKGKMDMQISPEQGEDKPEGIEDRISKLEQKYDELCDFVGMNDGKETSKEAPAAY